MTTLPTTTLPPTGPAAKARTANFDNTAGAETPGQFDAALPKPQPEKKARAVSYDPTAGAETPEASHTADAPEMSFWDLVDVVNPLQHLPIVGTIYRQVTGDTMGGAARIMGGALYGGPMGMLAGVAETLFEQATGADYGTQLAQLVTGKSAEKTIGVQTAMVDAAKTAAVSGAQTAAATTAGASTAATAAAAQAAGQAVQAAKAAAGTPDAAAEGAAKTAGPSALFQNLQKPIKAGQAQASGPVIEIRPAQRDQAQTAAARPALAAGGADAAAQKAGNPPALPQQLVADMMMGALDKYAKMKQPGESAGRTVDKAL